jgi:hypothetical protein
VGDHSSVLVSLVDEIFGTDRDTMTVPDRKLARNHLVAHRCGAAHTAAQICARALGVEHPQQQGLGGLINELRTSV